MQKGGRIYMIEVKIGSVRDFDFCRDKNSVVCLQEYGTGCYEQTD